MNDVDGQQSLQATGSLHAASQSTGTRAYATPQGGALAAAPLDRVTASMTVGAGFRQIPLARIRPRRAPVGILVRFCGRLCFGCRALAGSLDLRPAAQTWRGNWCRSLTDQLIC